MKIFRTKYVCTHPKARKSFMVKAYSEEGARRKIKRHLIDYISRFQGYMGFFAMVDDNALDTTMSEVKFEVCK